MKRIVQFLMGGLAVVFFNSTVMAVSLPHLTLLKMIDTGDKKGTEILSIQPSTRKMVVSNSIKGVVDIYSIALPSSPEFLKRIKLQLKKGEQVNSVAVHPIFNYFLAAIQAASPIENGTIQVRDLTSGQLIKTVSAGVGPDAVVIDHSGRYAMIPNEAEEFVFNRKTKEFTSPDGSVTLVGLAKEPAKITARQISLIDLTGTLGFVSSKDHRFLERGIDWDNSGDITEEPLDLNGNGKIDKGKVVVGTFRGKRVKAKEKKGEMFLFPMLDNKPDLLEPEYVAFTQSGDVAWVVLQENNGVIKIDTASGDIIGSFGLGLTRHKADIEDNDDIVFDTNIVALREPDGISLTVDNKYLVTADEGDTDLKASKVKSGPVGGGRTVSVFDAKTGELLGDTGNQIDEATFKGGFYPESRSDNKGSEPEMVTTFKLDGVNYAAVGLERANGVALISLAIPTAPVVVDVVAMDKSKKAGKLAPEGIVHFVDVPKGEHYIYTANEKNASIAVFKIVN